MAKSGYIKEIEYNILGGAVGSPWYNLGAVPPSVDLNTSYALSVEWENTGDETFKGHIAIVVTAPDGTTTTLTAASGQDTEVIAGGSATVIFDPITLSQAGTYSATFTLTETGETVVFDQNTASIATVAAAPTGIDLSSLVGLMITVMIVGMMMKMVTGTVAKK